MERQEGGRDRGIGGLGEKREREEKLKEQRERHKEDRRGGKVEIKEIKGQDICEGEREKYRTEKKNEGGKETE